MSTSVYLGPAHGQDIVGECLEGAEFTLVDEEAVFQTAKERCEGRGATLARIANFQEHTFVRSLLLSEGVEELFWIGEFSRASWRFV